MPDVYNLTSAIETVLGKIVQKDAWYIPATGIPIALPASRLQSMVSVYYLRWYQHLHNGSTHSLRLKTHLDLMYFSIQTLHIIYVYVCIHMRYIIRVYMDEIYCKHISLLHNLCFKIALKTRYLLLQVFIYVSFFFA